MVIETEKALGMLILNHDFKKFQDANRSAHYQPKTVSIKILQKTFFDRKNVISLLLNLGIRYR